MKIKSILILCWALLLTSSPALLNDPRPVVKIGIITPLTGNLAHIGEGYHNAATMAVETHAKTKFNYQLIFEDDQLMPSKAVMATNKLISVDKVQALISTWGVCGTVVSPIAEKNHTIHFAISWGEDVAKGFYNFDHFSQPADLAKRYALELKKRNLTRVAILTPNDYGAVQIIKALNEAFHKNGITVTGKETVGVDQRDFRTSIAKLAEKKPDTFCLFLFSPALEIAGRQFHEAGIKNLSCIAEFGVSQDPKMFEGLWYVDGAVGSDVFQHKYLERYKKIPPNEAPYVYDAVNMIIQGYENCVGKPLPSTGQVARYLVSLPYYDGVVGRVHPNTEGIFISQPVLKMIQNGVPVVIEK